jgi:hypothetical protein
MAADIAALQAEFGSARREALEEAVDMVAEIRAADEAARGDAWAWLAQSKTAAREDLARIREADAQDVAIWQASMDNDGDDLLAEVVDTWLFQDVAHRMDHDKADEAQAKVRSDDRRMQNLRDDAFRKSREAAVARRENWQEITLQAHKEYGGAIAFWGINFLQGTNRLVETSFDAIVLGGADLVMTSVDTIKSLCGKENEWKTISELGKSSEQAMASGTSLLELEAKLIAQIVLDTVTYGLWSGAQAGWEWYKTGDATQFAQWLGEWVAGLGVGAFAHRFGGPRRLPTGAREPLPTAKGRIEPEAPSIGLSPFGEQGGRGLMPDVDEAMAHHRPTKRKPIDSTRPTHGTTEHDATGYNQAKNWEQEKATLESRFNQQLVPFSATW